MFTFQNWKVKLAYAGFGCLFGSLCTIMGMLASPVTAQRDKFGEIECTKLTVVDAEGKAHVVLSTNWRDCLVDTQVIRLGSGLFDGGCVSVLGKDGKTKAELSAYSWGGRVFVLGKDGKAKAELSVHEDGGFFSVLGKDGKAKAELSAQEDGGRVGVWGKDGKSKAWLDSDKYGGYVGVWDKNGRWKASLGVNEHGGVVDVGGDVYDGTGRMLSKASLGVDEHGGRVDVFGKDGRGRAWLRVTKDGGRVQVNGKSEGAAVVGINEYGNGAVSTWDKDGKRQ